nr:hypothetical protein [Tanacetum cinerariifolium]
MAASSSSVVPTRRSGWTYDVFLSFRGEDSFINHLYAALVQNGISTFKQDDDEMFGGGKPISPEILKAIEESKFSVVVLTKNYANSAWCLEELAKIMECHDRMGQKVLPVFYHVDPSVALRGPERDFEKHEEAFTAAANLIGYHISSESDGGKYEIIDQIVRKILGNRGRESNLIDIESHMDALDALLDLEATTEVRVVVIYGMGGIGKTTIAQALFRRIAYKFAGSSFIKDVRENSSTKTDICALQQKILGDILMAHHYFIIEDPQYWANMIQERFVNKKVLLVLDDVDDVKQLEFLAATRDWFGPGSRIIITTRDMHLLSDANAKYEPALLRMDQAVELFSRHAFRKNSPPEGYKELSDRAIGYTRRLPLVLNVLGSYFRGRKAGVWESALDRIAEIPNSEIFKILKLSFDDLNLPEQQILLDIACFFKGGKVKDVSRWLDSFGFDPVIGISVLVERSLITVTKETLGMHDLIQEMCWKIVGESAPGSRLWSIDVVRDSIKENRKLEVIEGISVIKEIEDQGFEADVFESMKNLRLLNVFCGFTCDEPTLLPDELRWLCWNYYPFSSLPVADLCKLVGLEMECNAIEHLWEGHKNMLNLKFINLQSSGLIRFPDVSGAPNVERLILSYCLNLEEVHESLGFLKRLIYLDMNKCWNLKSLPSRLEMESLEMLILSSCHFLERFPELSPCMVKLSHIDLTACSNLEQLPSSIKYLSNLSRLDLAECDSLQNIPNSISELNCIKSLDLRNCWELQNLPDEFGRLENLQELHLPLAHGSVTFHVLTNLCSLRKLDLSSSQIGDKDFPENLHKLSSLEALNLSYNNELLELPASISHLSRLKLLDVHECDNLENMDRLPSGIQVLNATNCKSLRKIEDLFEGYEWLYKICLYDCNELLKDEESKRYIDKMKMQSFVKKYAEVDACLSIGIPRSKIPSWFKEQQHGQTITLKLPPKWQTQIIGFAISAVFKPRRLYNEPIMELRFENDGMHVPKPQIDASSKSEKGNLWIGYVPLSLFETIVDDGEDFQTTDWSHVIEGNLVIKISNRKEPAIRCGVLVVFKEEVESTQQTKPSYYQNWKLSQIYPNTYRCE